MVMQNQYINELTEKIDQTEIYAGTDRRFTDYNEGINYLVDVFSRHKAEQTQLFFIGNGGSSAIASHMTADYMKNGGMITCSLYDTSVLTCLGNDYGYEDVFSRQLEFLALQDDLLVAVSSSGKSQNIVNAIIAARKKGAKVVTFTGFDPDNPVRRMGDINIYVPCGKYGIVESIHNLILQEAVDVIMERDGICL